MNARFALPEHYDHQLKDEVCAWLESNHIEPGTVPLRSEVTVRDDVEIGYYVYADGRRSWAHRTTELLIAMPDDLAERWRIPPVLCDRCGQDVNTLPDLP